MTASYVTSAPKHRKAWTGIQGEGQCDAENYERKNTVLSIFDNGGRLLRAGTSTLDEPLWYPNFLDLSKLMGKN